MISGWLCIINIDHFLSSRKAMLQICATIYLCVPSTNLPNEYLIFTYCFVLLLRHSIVTSWQGAWYICSTLFLTSVRKVKQQQQLRVKVCNWRVCIVLKRLFVKHIVWKKNLAHTDDIRMLEITSSPTLSHGFVMTRWRWIDVCKSLYWNSFLLAGR